MTVTSSQSRQSRSAAPPRVQLGGKTLIDEAEECIGGKNTGSEIVFFQLFVIKTKLSRGTSKIYKWRKKIRDAHCQ